MYDKPQFEIPEAVRKLARSATSSGALRLLFRFMDMTRRVQDTLAKSSGAMASGAMELQTRVAEDRRAEHGGGLHVCL